MSKKAINQNTNYDSELLNTIESNFIFNENPINRMKNTTINQKKRMMLMELLKTKKLEH